MTSWAKRIKSRMKELDLTQEELASKLGITRGAITHYLAGRRVPPLRQFQKIAAVLKTDPAWLQFGTTKEKLIDDKKLKTEPRKQAIPILSWELAAELNSLTNIDKSEMQEWVPHLYTDKIRWYALLVNGDSMTAPIGRKSFHEGDIIIIDPDIAPSNNSFVVALLPKSKQLTFKQYVVDGGIRYLKPLNQQYPLIQIDEKTLICGVVVHCLADGI